MRTIVATLLIATVVTSASLAFAEQADPGDMGVFFTSNPISGAQAVLNDVGAFELFDVYVVSFDVPKGMEAYEFELPVPGPGIVTGGRLLPAGATDFGAGEDNWIVGTGGVCQGQVGPFTLVTYAAILFLAAPGNDVLFCLEGANPSSFPNGAPGYLACNSPGELHNFGAAYWGCATVNPLNIPQPIRGAKESFGGLKALFGGGGQE
jgi:hypothetical protein